MGVSSSRLLSLRGRRPAASDWATSEHGSATLMVTGRRGPFPTYHLNGIYYLVSDDHGNSSSDNNNKNTHDNTNIISSRKAEATTNHFQQQFPTATTTSFPATAITTTTSSIGSRPSMSTAHNDDNNTNNYNYNDNYNNNDNRSNNGNNSNNKNNNNSSSHCTCLDSLHKKRSLFRRLDRPEVSILVHGSSWCGRSGEQLLARGRWEKEKAVVEVPGVTSGTFVEDGDVVIRMFPAPQKMRPSAPCAEWCQAFLADLAPALQGMDLELSADQTYSLWGGSSGDCLADMMQGELGNCAVLAAVVALAGSDPCSKLGETLLERNVGDQRAIVARLFHPETGERLEWALGAKQDAAALQVGFGSAVPRYARSLSSRCWALLLELALAELAGGYEQLDGSTPEVAWLAICGPTAAPRQFTRWPHKGTWQGSVPHVDKVRKVARSSPPATTTATATKTTLFSELPGSRAKRVKAWRQAMRWRTTGPCFADADLELLLQSAVANGTPVCICPMGRAQGSRESGEACVSLVVCFSQELWLCPGALRRRPREHTLRHRPRVRYARHRCVAGRALGAAQRSTAREALLAVPFSFAAAWEQRALALLEKKKSCLAMLSLDEQGATPTDNRWWYLEGRQLAGNTQAVMAFGPSVHQGPTAVSENFTGVSDFQALSCTGLRQGVQIRFNLAALRAAQEYSFAFEGGTAAASAPDKVADAFSLQVLEPGGRVVESSYDIAAMRLRDFGSVKSPYLIWYDSPSPLGSLFVTFGLEISSRAPAGLQAIRFVLPDGLRHAAASSPRDAPTTSKSVTVAWRPSEVTKTPAGTFGDFAAWTLAEQSVGKGDAATTPVPEQPAADSNATNNGIAPSMTTPVPLEALPLLEDTYGWVNLGVRDQVEVRFNPSRPFPACELLVRFPVTLPNSLPALNVWRVTLVFAPSATDTGDEPPLTSFVVPGFGFGAISPANLVQHAQHVFQYSGHDYYEFSAEQANPATREAGFHSALVAGGLLLLGAWL
ncbi:unnamed protein product [Polarella glacialis]|uniref:Calpain catalytic domain-containing protein n=1 Tax=Polarella glacialis TaxID=89957 RepID=A0A813FL51_POLGL|nr:unnamed protein product [Polarella glacialis]